MNILVLGLGLNGGGRAAALYFAQNPENTVRISDIAKREVFGEGIKELEGKGIQCVFEDIDPRDNIRWADIVIKNPAIPQNHPHLALAKVLSNDFAYLFNSEDVKKMKVICVTGTKGKTTTVAAIHHALTQMGKRSIYCGNIGVSAFTVLEEIERRKRENEELPEYVVCELSSWQVHDTWIALNGHMPNIELAIFTSIYADHQNAYNSISSYVNDKLKLFGPHCRYILIDERIKKFFAQNTHGLSKKTKLFPGLYNPFIKHNRELCCAFRALKILGFHKKDIIKAVSTYKGMPHRIENVAIEDNIMYVNDSAATISEAVSFSINNLFPLSIHLICGGTDKELKALGMQKAIRTASTVTLLDGSFTKKKLIPLLKKNKIKYSGPFRSMEEAFNVAKKNAELMRDESNKMQVVLLSPGAASFELFKNEFDRGDQFKALVMNSLTNKETKED
ncbi:MAG: UDP-N-acetylmuramoyl-L-alanine--D-glutamate ligase [Sphaerochaetaceae bacterium]|nr:UDP-N-acetylmuramoyl-L-alanine--D-glutamate ligase [Sphaerochaetaceae bacterium]